MPTATKTASQRKYPDHYYPQVEQFSDDPRQKVQKIEIETRTAIATATRRLIIFNVRQQIDRLIDPIRAEIGPLEVDAFNVPDSAIEPVKEEAARAAERAAANDLQKNAFIKADAKKIEGLLDMAFSPDERAAFHAGLVALQEIQKRVDRCDEQLNHPQAKMYRDLFEELKIAFHLLHELYDKGLYEGSLRRTQASFFGILIAGGAGDQLTPVIRLMPGLSKEAASELLNKKRPAALTASLVPAGLLAGAVKALAPRSLLEKVRQWRQGGQKNADWEGLRRNMLDLVAAEIHAWEAKIASGGSREEHMSLASWRLLERYLNMVIELSERVEGVHRLTAQELIIHLGRLQELRRGSIEQIHGTAGFDARTLFENRRITKPFDMHEFIILHFRKFMEVLNAFPLVDEICAFAESENTDLHPHVHDTLFAYHHFSYKYPDQENCQQHIAAYELGGDIIMNDAGTPGIKRVNPKLFYRGSLRTRVLLRLVESIGRSDWGYQAALLTGEGNALKTSTFAQALAEKMWAMERKWRTLSAENKHAWLKGKFGRVIDEEGNYADTICLGADDYHTG